MNIDQETLHSVASNYLAAGLCALPAIRAEKRPAVGRWKRYRNKLPTEAELSAWFANEPDAVCILCGSVSGNTEIIDFDAGGELFSAWCDRIPAELLERLVVERTPSGGFHVAYRCDTEICGNLKLAQRQNGGKVVTLIETRGEGGLFLCAPTPGYEVIQGDLCRPPLLSEAERDILLRTAWELNEYVPPVVDGSQHSPPVSQTSPLSVGQSNCLSNNADRPGDDFNHRGDVRAVLRKHGWALAQSGENEYWRRPGKASGWSATLKDGVFYIFSTNAAPFEPNRAYSPFAAYALLEHSGDYAAAASALRSEGYGSDATLSGDVDLTYLIGGDEGEGERPGPCVLDPGPFPEHLLRVPGFISEAIDYDLATATRPQPILALAGAICLQAVLAARKVRDERGNRTNLYCVGIAEAGAGKDHARKNNKKILFHAGLDGLEGNEELASDAGLVTAVEQQPAVLFQLDEFGRLLRTIGDPKKAPHLFNLLGTLMKLYSSADTIFRSKAYADAKRNKVIDQPCVSLYGTTVPEHFFESLTADSLSDGFVARLLVFESHSRPPRRYARQCDVPEPIIARARAWGTFQTSGNLNAEHPEPTVVPYIGEARQVFDAFAERIDVELARRDVDGRSLWTRAEEKACRLALAYACSVSHQHPEIDRAAAEWACELSEYLTRRTLFTAHEWIADGVFDGRQKRVLRVIRHAGRLTRNNLCIKTRWLSQRERHEVIENLKETRQIREIETQTKGRPRVEYEAR